MRYLLLILLMSTSLHFLSLPVYAHKVNVFAWVDGDNLVTRTSELPLQTSPKCS